MTATVVEVKWRSYSLSGTAWNVKSVKKALARTKWLETGMAKDKQLESKQKGICKSWV